MSVCPRHAKSEILTIHDVPDQMITKGTAFHSFLVKPQGTYEHFFITDSPHIYK